MNHEHVSSLFPKAKWTGGSGIHVSFAMNATVPIDFNNKAAVMSLLSTANYQDFVWKAVQSRFGNMEWLLEEVSFKNLLMVDMSRKLAGLCTSETPDRIKNPSTGNLFHRIALLNPYIGAIRFWTEEAGYGQTNIGFRFRIVTQKDSDEEENVRESARRLTEVVEEQAEEVTQYLECCEPPLEADVAVIKDKLTVFED